MVGRVQAGEQQAGGVGGGSAVVEERGSAEEKAAGAKAEGAKVEEEEEAAGVKAAGERAAGVKAVEETAEAGRRRKVPVQPKPRGSGNVYEPRTRRSRCGPRAPACPLPVRRTVPSFLAAPPLLRQPGVRQTQTGLAHQRRSS